MNVKSITNRIKKNDAQSQKNDKNKIIGALLKKRRVEMNKTISEFSDGICSISYQSKVESNKIIPRPEYLSLLMERANININEIDAIQNSEELLRRSINYFFDQNEIMYKAFIEEYENIKDNPCIEIIRFGYYTLTYEYNKATDSFDSILKYASSLDQKMLLTVAYFAGFYHLYLKQYKEAEEIESVFSSIILDKDFYLPFLDFKFELHLSEGKYIALIREYDRLLDECILNNELCKITKYKMMYSRMLIDRDEIKDALEILYPLNDSFSPYENDTLNYLLSICFYKLGNTIGCKEFLDEIAPVSPYFRYVLDMKYELSEDKDDFLSFVKLLVKENKNDFYLNYFIQSKSQTLSLDIINSDAFKEEYQISDFSGKLRLLKIQYDLFCSESRYKDACQILNKINRIRHLI